MVLWTAVACGFTVHAAQVEKSVRAAQAAHAAEPLPTFPFRYAGRLERDGFPPSVALTHGGDTYVVAAGEVFGTSYRLEHIGSDHLTVTYLPLKRKQTIAFSSIPQERPAAAAPSPVAPVPAPAPKTTLGTPVPTCC